MTQIPVKKIILEPWSLGDALIAAWAASKCRHADDKISLACAGRFHEVIRAIYPELDLIALELNYTSKNGRFSFRELFKRRLYRDEKGIVYSIRGDVRDFVAALILFPKFKIQMCGWEAFFARRLLFLDQLYRTQRLQVVNRYHRWSSLLKLAEPASQPRAMFKKSKPRVGIHIGAQWNSKRYPLFLELGRKLEDLGHEVTLISGPGDPITNLEKHVALEGAALVIFLRDKVDLLITNDSAPMHLGFALDIPTLALFGNTGVKEWLPPGVKECVSIRLEGYKPAYPYTSDANTLDTLRWPAVTDVILRLYELGWVSQL